MFSENSLPGRSRPKTHDASRGHVLSPRAPSAGGGLPAPIRTALLRAFYAVGGRGATRNRSFPSSPASPLLRPRATGHSHTKERAAPYSQYRTTARGGTDAPSRRVRRYPPSSFRGLSEGLSGLSISPSVIPPQTPFSEKEITARLPSAGSSTSPEATSLPTPPAPPDQAPSRTRNNDAPPDSGRSRRDEPRLPCAPGVDQGF